jgi:hypothetical protein
LVDAPCDLDPTNPTLGRFDYQDILIYTIGHYDYYVMYQAIAAPTNVQSQNTQAATIKINHLNALYLNEINEYIDSIRYLVRLSLKYGCRIIYEHNSE